jgi:hypothetical protein
MSELLSYILQVLIHVLDHLIGWIAPDRFETMHKIWAIIAGIALAIGFALVIAAAWTGQASLFNAFVGCLIAAIIIVIVGAFWPGLRDEDN